MKITKPIRTDYGEIPEKVAKFIQYNLPFGVAQSLKNVYLQPNGDLVLTPSYEKVYELNKQNFLHQVEDIQKRKGYIFYQSGNEIRVHIYNLNTYTLIADTNIENTVATPTIFTEIITQDVVVSSALNPELVGGGILIFGLTTCYYIGGNNVVNTFKILYTGGSAGGTAILNPIDGIIFQQRLWIWCTYPSIVGYVEGVRLIVSDNTSIDSFTTTTGTYSIQYKIYLDGDERILSMSDLQTCIGVATTKNFRLIYSEDTITEGIVATNIKSKSVYAVECLPIKILVLTNVVMLFTVEGIYYRRLESLTETLQNIFDTSVFKAFDTNIVIEGAIVLGSSIYVIYDRGVKRIPANILSLDNKWFMPATTYLYKPDIKTISIGNSNHLYIKKSESIEVYKKSEEPVPLTFFERLNYRVTVVNVSGNQATLSFPDPINSQYIKGVWLVKSGKMGYLERITYDSETYRVVNSGFNPTGGDILNFIVTTEKIQEVYNLNNRYILNLNNELHTSEGHFKLDFYEGSILDVTVLKEYDLIHELQSELSWDSLDETLRSGYEINCCPNFNDVAEVEGSAEFVRKARHSYTEAGNKIQNKHEISEIFIRPRIVVSPTTPLNEYDATLPAVYINYIE